jgi:hypothetical protein
MPLQIPFQVRGKRGMVTVDYQVGDVTDPWGFALLALAFPPEAIDGFPVCSATVSYEGVGYHAMMGWIQIIHCRGTQTYDIVDQPPQLTESQMPYCYWGPSPSFFDAPGNSAQGLIWTADAFLVLTPDALITRVIQPICGFHWGWSTETEKPAIFPIEPISTDAWERARSVLEPRYPGWTFRQDWATESYDVSVTKMDMP